MTKLGGSGFDITAGQNGWLEGRMRAGSIEMTRTYEGGGIKGRRMASIEMSDFKRDALDKGLHEPLCTCPNCNQQIDVASMTIPSSFVLPKNRPELFYIPNETFFAIEGEEIAATYGDMVKMDIARLPYPLLDIGVQGNLIMRLKESEKESIMHRWKDADPLAGDVAGMFHKWYSSGIILGKRLRDHVAECGDNFDNWELRFRFQDEEPVLCMVRSPHKLYFDLNKIVPGGTSMIAAKCLREILIVLLATKNAVKARTKDKLLALGIGEKKNSYKPLYTTTITIPKALTDAAAASKSHGSGTPKRPHLRRGHIRKQRFGPKLCMVRPQWIEPVFVNVDEDYAGEFVSERSAYNATLG